MIASALLAVTISQDGPDIIRVSQSAPASEANVNDFLLITQGYFFDKCEFNVTLNVALEINSRLPAALIS